MILHNLCDERYNLGYVITFSHLFNKIIGHKHCNVLIFSLNLQCQIVRTNQYNRKNEQ